MQKEAILKRFLETKVSKLSQHNNLIYILKQGVQGLQAFAFCVVTINDKYMEPRFKRKRTG